MIALEAEGLVTPEVAEAIELVVSKRCTCACDRWRITPKGIALVQSWNVVIAKGGE